MQITEATSFNDGFLDKNLIFLILSNSCLSRGSTFFKAGKKSIFLLIMDLEILSHLDLGRSGDESCDILALNSALLCYEF